MQVTKWESRHGYQFTGRNEGYCKMYKMHPTQAMINYFLVKWPGAEWGPAHIVLSDYNLEDEWLDSTMNHLEFAMQDIESGANKAASHSIDELFATLEFMRTLKAIPEDERCVLDG